MFPVSREIGRMASSMGTGGVGVSGKKTLSKLEGEDVGHCWASWWHWLGSKGDEVLGELSMSDLGRSGHRLSELRKGSLRMFLGVG